MKKLFSLFIALTISALTFAQLSGTYTVGTSGTYPTIQAAISALNISGISGPVVFNVAADHTETLASPTAGTITASGTVSNPIVFQKSGIGANPLITAGVGTSTTTDGIIKIAGGDYITFDGIDVQENSLNLTTTARMEWGYALVKKQATAPFDGCQNVTIMNCSITLNKAQTTSVGIYSGPHIATSMTTLGYTSATDALNNCKFYGNSIQNIYIGISLNGYNASSPYSLYDQNNEIGVTSGNTITNYGGSNISAHGIYTIYQNNLKIAGNTINGGINQTATFYGIMCSNATNASMDVYNNTITLNPSSTSSTTYGIYFSAGGSGTNNTINIYNNSIQNCILSSALSAPFYGLYMITSSPYILNFYGNQVINNTIGSVSSTATGGIYGVYLGGNPNSTTGSYWKTYNNTVSGNTRIQSTLGSATFYGIYQVGYGLTTDVYNNSIHDNTMPNMSSNHYLLYVGGTTTTTKNIYGNQVYNHFNSGGYVYGLYNSGGLISNIYKNNIYNLNNIYSSGYVYGFYNSSGITTNFYNNFISELKAPNSTIYPAVYGAYISSGSFVNLYYNSIYLDATTTQANFGSVGLYCAASPILDLRNNIIINNSACGSSGYTIAFRYAGTSYTNLSATNNNNCWYAGDYVSYPNHYIFFDGTNYDQTLAAMKTRLANREVNSFSEMPPFINTSSSPYNLHLNSSTPTQCESGGQRITSPSIIADYDENTRWGETGYSGSGGATDIGADEGNFVTYDLNGPLINYTPLTNYALVGVQTLSTTITDASGVPTTGAGLPKIYWRINGGSWNNASATYISGSQYDFTLGSGSVTGDKIEYYIVAQDQCSSINISCSPISGAAGFTSNPPACSTPPSVLNAYVNISPLSGTKTINGTLPTSGNNYQTFQDAFFALNNHGISGSVIFDVSAGQTFTESCGTNNYALKLDITGTSTNTITFRKSGAGTNPVINILGSSGITDAGIWLNGSDYITFDGINIKDFGTTSNNWLEYGFLFQGSATDGVSYTTIKNCTVTLSQFNTSSNGFRLNSQTAYVSSGGNSYNNLINNTVKKATYGYNIIGNINYLDKSNKIAAESGSSLIDSIGSAGLVSSYNIYASYQDSIIVDGLKMSNTNGTGVYGIYLGYCKNYIVQNDTLSDMNASSSVLYGIDPIYCEGNNIIKNNLIYNLNGTTTVYGIYRYYGGSTNSISQNNINSCTSTGGNVFGIMSANSTATDSIFNNTVNNLNYNGTGAFVACGVATSGIVTTFNVYIFNNYVYDIKGSGSTSTNPIAAFSFMGGNVRLYYNTGFLNSSTGANSLTATLYSSSSSILDSRNNILVNKSITATGKTMAFWWGSSSYSNITASTNNNLYYSGIPSAQNLIFYDGLNMDQTLSTYTGRMLTKDQASQTEDVPFISSVSPYNLHIQPVSTIAESSGQVISGFNTDFDNQIRFGSLGYSGTGLSSDMGADEFSGTSNYSCSTPIPGNTISTENPICIGNTIQLSLQNSIPGTGISYQWQNSINGSSYTDIVGANLSTLTLIPDTSNYYRCKVSCINGSTSAYSNPIHITFNTMVATTTPGSRCGIGSVLLGATATSGTIKWYSTPTGGVSLGSGNTFNTPSISNNTDFYAEASTISAGGSVIVGNDATFTNITGVTPYSSAWEGSREQYLISSSELLALGLQAGNITSLAFNVISSGNYIQNNFTIKLATTSNSSITGNWGTPNGSFTNVYGPVSLSVPNVGWNTYNFSTPFYWDGVSNILVDICHDNDIANTCANCYGSSSTVAYSLTSFDAVFGRYADNIQSCGSSANSALTSTYYRYRPNMKFIGNASCPSPRVAVKATINTSPTINVSANPSSVCIGQNTTISATSSGNPSYTYTWVQGNLSGANQTVSPSSTTTYTVNAVDNSGGTYNGCASTANLTVTVNELPSFITTTPSISSICLDNIQNISASTFSDSGLVNESFNGAISSWSNENYSINGTPTNAAWTVQNDGYVYSTYTFHSNDNSAFFLSNSDAQGNGGTTNTILNAPVVNTTGFNNLTLSFYHHFKNYAGATNDSISVEVSTDNITWSTLQKFSGSTIGSSSLFSFFSVNMNAWINVPTLYLRFHYTSAYGYFWAIDNVKLNSTYPASTLTWSPLTGLFTDASATVPYTGTIANSVYAKPSANTSYIATATSAFGCVKTATSTVNILAKPTAVATSASTSICQGDSTQLSFNLTGASPWNVTLNDGINPSQLINGIASTPYTVYVKPSSATNYSISTISDGNSCSNTSSAQTAISFKEKPTAITISPAAASICTGSIQLLTASGGTNNDITLLNETFNGVNSWTTVNNSSGGISANAAWTMRNDGFVYASNTFHSNDASRFYLSNSDAQGSGGITNSQLISPSMSTLGYNSLYVTYWHHLAPFTGTGKVEISTDGGSNWITLKTHTSTQGAVASFVKDSINLNSYIQFSSVKIRFVYYDEYGWFWAIDNVVLKGSQSPIVWSPTSNLYSNSSATIPYTGAISSTVYAKPAFNSSFIASSVNSFGCSNSDTVAISLLPLPTANYSFSSSSICSGDSIQLSVNLTGSQPWNLVVNNGTTPVSYTNITSTPFTFYVKPSITSTYSITSVSDANLCSNSGASTALITVNPNPSPGVVTDKSICIGNSVSIGNTSVGGHTYLWSSNPSGFSSTNANPSVSPTITTTYTLVETNTSTTCYSSGSVKVTVNPLPVANAGSNSTICANSSVQIGSSAISGNTYSWVSNPTGFTSTVANPIVSPTVVSTYTLTETITATGCSNTGNVTINLNPIPSANTGSNSEICMGASIQIGSSSIVGNTYSWSSNPAGFTSSVSNPTVNPTITTTYTLTETITATACNKSNFVVVTVNPLPLANTGGNKSICHGQSTQIGSTAIVGNSYRWTSNPSGYTSTTANPTIAPTITTTYTLTETVVASGCQKVNTCVITVNPLPIANSGSPSTICSEQSASIGSTSIVGNSYSWTSNPSGFTSTVSNPTVSPSITTTYTLTETITITGCNKSNAVVITVNPTPSANVGSNKSICIGNSTQIGASTISGNTYSWTSNPSGFTSSVSNPTVSPTITTTYTLTETTTSTGCNKSNAVVVTVNALPSVSFTGLNSVYCLNASTSTLVPNPIGGTFSGNGISGTNFSAASAGIGSHIITYSYTDLNSCTNSTTKTTQVNNVSTGYETVTACNSYTWPTNSTTYTTSGIYTKTLTNSVGCDSLVTLNLTINYSTAGSSNVTACNTYTWDGSTYTTSGSYVKHYTNAKACDSTATLNLTINYSTLGSQSITACDTYTWDGTTYTTSGSYVKHYTNANGCDSTATLNLTINYSTSGSQSVTACDTYTWDGTTYTTSGSYVKHYTNAANCDSTATLNLTINYSTSGSSNVTACNSYDWDGTTYTTSGSYVKHYTNASNCDSTATLNLTINYSTSGSSNVTACNSYDWDGTTYTTSGSYVKHYTNAANCDSTATLNLTINHSTSGSQSVTACDTYTWDGTTYTTSGSYVKHYTNAANCDSTATLNLTINYSNQGSQSVTACDTYTWDGTTYTTSGSYVKHYTNAANCDSTATLNLTINNSTSGSQSVTACNSYDWDGTTYTTSGSYVKHYSNAANCDSTATLNLTINHSTVGSQSIIACDTYTWDGTTYTTSGSYVKHYTNASNCDSTATLNLTINHSTSGSQSVTACDTYTWDGTTYTTSGSYVKHYTNAANCDSTATLNLTINYSTSGSSSVTACDAYDWDGTTYTTSGSYVKHYTNAANCDSTATLNLTINYSTAGSSTVTACDTYTWDGTTYTTSGSYVKHYQNAANCDSTATLNLTINYSTTGSSSVTACNSYTWDGTTYTTSGLYVKHYTNAAGCDSSSTLNLTINYSNSGSESVTACNTYTWQGSTYTTSGVYTATLQNVNGCDSIATLNLIINYSTSASETQTACDTYTWDGTTYTTSGSYVKHYSNAVGCDSTATLNLTINYSTSGSSSVTACDSYTWDGTTYTTSGSYVKHYTNAANCDSTATLNLTINYSTSGSQSVTACDTYTWDGTTYTTSGSYVKHYTNAANCDSTATLNLIILTTPIADAGNDVSISIGGTGNIIGTPSVFGYSYLWTPTTGLNDSSLAQPTANPIDTTHYFLTVSNGICSASDSVWVNVIKTLALTGTVTYDNTASTPINGAVVYLKKNGIAIDSTITNSLGEYRFDVFDGTYTLAAKTSKHWGGVNSSDALLVQRYFSGLITLSPNRKLAADVNGNNAVNSSDALIIKRRFAGLINSFSVGDWMFNADTVIMSGTANITNIKALCFGDLNGSYIPLTAKGSANIKLLKKGSLQVNNNQEYDIPVRVLNSLQTGAISMIMNYSSSIEIVSIASNASNYAGIITNIKDGKLYLAWNNLQPLDLQANDVLFIVRVKVLSEIKQDDELFQIDSESELADEFANAHHGIELYIPSLTTAPIGINTSTNNTLTLSSYPNPFNNQTTIVYNLPTTGKVQIRLYDMNGKLVKNLNDEIQSIGNQTLVIEGDELSEGLYHIQIFVSSESTVYVGEKTIMRIR